MSALVLFGVFFFKNASNTDENTPDYMTKGGRVDSLLEHDVVTL